jgi:5-methylcytosine-specific restriction endonuclease McrA
MNKIAQEILHPELSSTDIPKKKHRCGLDRNPWYKSAIRNWLIAKCGGVPRCAYCGVQVPIIEITLDHIIPISKGGRDKRENIALSCLGCNGKKKDKEWIPLFRDIVSVDYRRFSKEAWWKHHKKKQKPIKIIPGLISIGNIWPECKAH